MEITYEKGVGEFILSLSKTERGKLIRIIALLERHGNNLRMPHSKPLGNGLFELRVRGYEVRILYAFKDGKVVLLHAFLKKSSPVPYAEIAYARKIMRLT